MHGEADAAAPGTAADARLRVLHCPWNVGCNPATLARFEREQGLVSHSVALTHDPFGFRTDEILFDPGIDVIEQAHRRTTLLRRALRDFDVIHFNFGQTIIEKTGPPQFPELRSLHWHGKPYIRDLYYYFLWFAELPLLRAWNKVIVMTYQGDDARQGDFCRAHFEFSPAETADYYTAAADQQKRQSIRRIARYADRIYSLNPDLLHVLPMQAVFLPYASVDPDEWRVASPADDTVPVVLHAPSNRAAKGTQFILDAVDQLRGEGIPFEFVLVENLRRDDALRHYERAHLIIDQLLVGWYGAFAIEVMAMGKPVICYIREQDLSLVPPEMARDLPIVGATPATISDVLREFLTRRRGELGGIGLSARRFVEKWHNPRIIAAEVIRDYATLTARKRGRAARLAEAVFAGVTGRRKRSWLPRP